MEARLRFCSACDQWLPRAAFSRKSASRKHRHRLATECRTCHAAQGEARRQERRERINEIKLARGCDRCGYNEHAVALDFDHRPGEVKSFNVSSAGTRSWALIELEMAKCDVLCANCHRVVTAERRVLVEV